MPVKKPRDRADASLAKGESRASPGPITGNLGTAGSDWSGAYLELVRGWDQIHPKWSPRKVKGVSRRRRTGTQGDKATAASAGGTVP